MFEEYLRVCPFLPTPCTSGCCHSALCDEWKEVVSVMSVACPSLKHLDALLGTGVLSSYRQDSNW